MPDLTFAAGQHEKRGQKEHGTHYHIFRTGILPGAEQCLTPPWSHRIILHHQHDSGPSPGETRPGYYSPTIQEKFSTWRTFSVEPGKDDTGFLCNFKTGSGAGSTPAILPARVKISNESDSEYCTGLHSCGYDSGHCQGVPILDWYYGNTGDRDALDMLGCNTKK